MNAPEWPMPLGHHARDAEDGSEDNGNIQQRNGIWVVTINGTWRGDYRKREHAIAAVQAAGHDAR